MQWNSVIETTLFGDKCSELVSLVTSTKKQYLKWWKWQSGAGRRPAWLSKINISRARQKTAPASHPQRASHTLIVPRRQHSITSPLNHLKSWLVALRKWRAKRKALGRWKESKIRSLTHVTKLTSTFAAGEDVRRRQVTFSPEETLVLLIKRIYCFMLTAWSKPNDHKSSWEIKFKELYRHFQTTPLHTPQSKQKNSR